MKILCINKIELGHFLIKYLKIKIINKKINNNNSYNSKICRYKVIIIQIL